MRLSGRPNVGKSSIFNSLVGQERSIVSDVAGTTRDAIDTPVVRNGQKYLFIDTAGMRRKGKIDEPIEKYSIIRSLRAVDRSDVVLMVIDAVDGVTEQDKKIAGYAHEAGKGIVIVVNKWGRLRKGRKLHPALYRNPAQRADFYAVCACCVCIGAYQAAYSPSAGGY